jgi:UDP-glucose 4-epimerase
LYLVTGGAGFIGSHLVRFVLAQGERVRVLDNFSTGKRSNLEGVLGRIELVEGDLRDFPTVAKAVDGVDYIFHQGAIPSVPRSIDTPLESHAANATGTLVLLEAARQGGRVGRVVYASSSSVYGANESLPKRETMVAEPLSPYAVSKLAAEHYCVAYTRIHGLETVSLRYFNVFGPRQDPSSPYSGVVSRFIDALVVGRRPAIFGDGEQSRDFTYIDNVVQANWLSCHSPITAGRVYNVGCGVRVTINELWRSMAKLVGSEIEPAHQEARSGDVRHSLASIDRAREDFGYNPRVALEEGLERTLTFYGAWETRGASQAVE